MFHPKHVLVNIMWTSNTSCGFWTLHVYLTLYCWETLVKKLIIFCSRRGGLMVSMLGFGSRGLVSSPGRSHWVVYLDKTLISHSASLSQGEWMAAGDFCAGGGRRWGALIRRERSIEGFIAAEIVLFELAYLNKKPRNLSRHLLSSYRRKQALTFLV